MIFNVGAGGVSNADKLKYNNNKSGLESTNVQGAVDELSESVDSLNESLNVKSINMREVTLQIDAEYVCPSNGLVTITNDATGDVALLFYDNNGWTWVANATSGINIMLTTPVYKGQKIKMTRNNGTTTGRGWFSPYVY